MNYSKMPTHKLMRRVATLNGMKERGYCAGLPLTQLGLDWINGELSAIDTELDSRKPDSKLQTLFDENWQPAGFAR